MSKFDTYTAKASDLLNSGFSSKAGQKDALDLVSRAYREVRDEWFSAQIAAAPYTGIGRQLTSVECRERSEFFYGKGAIETPFDLHQVRDRHYDAFETYVPGSSVKVRDLVALRETIKAAAIVPPAKDEQKVRAAAIVESIKARMERLGVRYLEAIDLCEVFEDGVAIRGLSATAHYVTNEHGTTFLRTFYYLHGKLTPLNVILAAAEEAARRAEVQ